MTAQPDFSKQVVDYYVETPEQVQLRSEDSPSSIHRPKRSPLAHRFFVWSAGVDPEVLRLVPQDAPRYVALGASVVVNGLLSGVTATFTVYLTFSQNAAIAISFGFVWLMITLSLDRFMAATEVGARPSSRTRNATILTSLPRLAVGLLVAMFVTQVLLLAIFRPEISAELRSQQLAAVQEFNEPLEQDIATLNDQIADTQARLAAEILGQGGSGAPGTGAESRQLETLLQSLQAQRAALVQQSTEAANSISTQQGIIAQLQTFDRLRDQSSAVARVSVALLVLLCIIYTIPVLLVLLSPRSDTYHKLLELRTSEVVRSAEREVAFRQRRKTSMPTG